MPSNLLINFNIRLVIKILTQAIFLSLYTINAFASFNGYVAFTEDEKLIHRESISALTAEADQCLKNDLNRHQEFFKKYGISAFYGQNSVFSKLSEKEKINFLISKKLDPKLSKI